MKWTKEEEVKIVELLKEGGNYESIGKELNRSSRSIKEKLNDLGYKFSDYKRKHFYEIIECVNCKKEFEDLKTKQKKFCSQSCSVSFNNKGCIKNPKGINGSVKKEKNKIEEKIRIKKFKSLCIVCNKDCNNKFCSQDCLRLFNWDLKKIKIEEGNVNSRRVLRKYKFEKDGHKCQICEQTTWNDKEIPLVLDHIDGNPYNNFPDNLRLICPNCDAQTDTYKGKNKGNGRHERMKRYYDGKSF